MTAATTPRRFAVIGGGISGLACAHRLRELAPHISLTLFEASDRLGGVLRTERRDGYCIEHSADNFVTDVPAAVRLCERLGLAEQLLTTEPGDRRALVVHAGQLFPVPEGFLLMAPGLWWPVLTTPILSWRGKLRLAWERFVPRRQSEDEESLATFARRRLGREAFDRLVQPLVGGIYTADPEQLSVSAALPQFAEMERQHGSLSRGLRRRRARATPVPTESGARYSQFMSLRDGMSSLVDALARSLPADSVRRNAPVRTLERRDNGWLISAGEGPPESFDAVCVAAPAPHAAKILATADRPLADALAGIPYAGCVVAVVGYGEEQFGAPLNGFGFVVPEIEHRRVLACSFSSRKYSGRAPDGQVLLRVFMGGACHPECQQWSDAQIERTVREELADLLHIHGSPRFLEIVRWQAAMPQYHVGHGARVAEIEARLSALPGMALAGNAYQGVGVPQCIASGERAAERLLGS